MRKQKRRDRNDGAAGTGRGRRLGDPEVRTVSGQTDSCAFCQGEGLFQPADAELRPLQVHQELGADPAGIRRLMQRADHWRRFFQRHVGQVQAHAGHAQ